MAEEKFSDFIAQYTKEINGKQSIDIVAAFIELYARVKTKDIQIREMQEALGDFATFLEGLEKRINILEGKKTIISLGDLK